MSRVRLLVVVALLFLFLNGIGGLLGTCFLNF